MHLHSQFGISIEGEGENIPSLPPLPLRDRQASSARRRGRPPLTCTAKPHRALSPGAAASSVLCQCSGPCPGLGPAHQIWAPCFLTLRNVAKNVNSKKSASTVYFSTTFLCSSFLPADEMLLLCPHLLKSFICPVDTFMLQPSTTLGLSYLADTHPLSAQESFLPLEVGVWRLCPSQV